MESTTLDNMDAIVVGSGFGGAVASCRLAQAGVRVLLLERGRRYEANDFPALPPPDRTLPDARRWRWQHDQGLWDVQDLEEIVSVQAAGYGGGSLIYANVQLRPPPSVFDHKWPLKYRGGEYLEPYYDLAAFMLDIAPASCHPSFPFVKSSRLAGVSHELGREAGFFLPPLAISYSKQENAHGEQQNACTGCGKCCTGCPSRAKNTLDLNYLSVAERNGAVVRTQCEVTRITQLKDGWCVRYFDHLLAQHKDVRTHALFLCAGSIHSTRLLAGARFRRESARVRSRVGIGYFPNADAAAVVYDAAAELFPSKGPAITTATTHWSDPRGRFFMVQDGGYAEELARLSGVLRAPLWLGRNRIAQCPEPRAERSSGRAATAGRFAGMAVVSPLDAALDALAEGALALARPDGLGRAWPAFLKELERPLLLRSVVERTLDRALIAQHRRWALTRRLAPNGRVLRALRWLQKLFIRGFGGTESLAAEALGALLEAGGSGRHDLAREIFGYDDRASERRLLLLAMGRDSARGVLIYDRRRGTLTADLDLYHLAPGYTKEEQLMKDIAESLGGELRANPAWAFLGKPITVHSQGGCRMSDDPRDGVTLPSGQVHGCPGLYVLDGSSLCASVGVNPAATILAIAEANVLEFIRKEKHDPSWPEGDPSEGAREYARQRAGALAWRARATQQKWKLSPPLAPKVDFRSEPIGLTFRETMHGYCAPVVAGREPRTDAEYRLLETAGRPEQATLLKLTANVPNLTAFFEDETHSVRLTGTIELRLPGHDHRSTLSVEGVMQLFVPRYKPYGLTPGPRRRAQARVAGNYRTRVGVPHPRRNRWMRYLLSLDHDRWRLEGYKRIHQDPGLDTWRDTSALFVSIGEPRVNADGHVVPFGKRNSLVPRLAGVVHVDLTGFTFDQLRSFEVTGTTDPARISWAIIKFATFFFGSLQRVYMPELESLFGTLFRPFPNNVRSDPGPGSR